MSETTANESNPVDNLETLAIGTIISLQRQKELLAKSEPLTAEEKYDLVRSVGEECVQDSELKNLLAKKPNPICYDGFEPSGRMHIAQGILKSINVNKCTKGGCTFIFWVADWFALLNNKMGGDLKKIRTVGEYMIEGQVWKACGMDMQNVKFIWSSDEINSHSNEYWLKVMDISRRFKLPRVKRCSQIMGRGDDEELFASQIFYPCMQCADIFHLKADICQLGVDQRKVNMLAREYCDEVKIKNKPIILSHHMIMGLGKGQAKMSKSDPNSAIFMEDTEADVNVKIKQSWCPEKETKDNPLFDYLKHIIFPKLESFVVKKKPEYGGDKSYTSYEEVASDFESGALHPGDLKPAVAAAINEIIRPVREHFQNDPVAKKLLDQVKKFKVTK
ncbi:hypothetical protein PROFUN_13643 [Planoprotostelium fungivorum]|uniref:tyrosine--tRNA ligase n=2 Tax=Planoprotostelium fungivorum TaxID=1890364 RepID=A0A2P6N3D3_9EUKA|nr:hypothetical protein PROFUN_13643 [Planoprotostelium fungivorum]